MYHVGAERENGKREPRRASLAGLPYRPGPPKCPMGRGTGQRAGQTGRSSGQPRDLSRLPRRRVDLPGGPSGLTGRLYGETEHPVDQTDGSYRLTGLG
uniref:Uncharacterized protein n=1 Tax=Candidatus Kentrum sp. FM TaxID=2126340 RepID=A0A450SEQ2_9GAMM|nr:MAG: hypothetical protein BECKFM1743A_GA0114220_1009113 [Candidatus Kentron sp. FM]VFJ51305.1 MAG: hypothetical protein BECKFM1743C_GA0114222_1009513 [Candidatus Kentron sp. FM]VFK08880.1 MAG: hypothetical protein BECKFM1743B_GA0114221_1008412 [Candidatus Kentron sp. FM]